MKGRIRTLVRVCRARTRLRDLAAAELSVAEEARLAAETRRRHAEDELHRMLGEGAERFRQSPASRTLVQFDDERGDARFHVGAADAQCRAAEAESQRRRNWLRERERQLRTGERLLERARDALAVAEHKAEQRTVDDIVATRAYVVAKEQT